MTQYTPRPWYVNGRDGYEVRAETDVELRAINAALMSALLAIANMKIGSNTDSAQLSALCIATARAAIAKATGREQDQ